MATAGTSRHPGGRPRTHRLSSWGRKVEALAQAKGLTRRDVAEKTGISAPSLWALLVGKSKPKFETVCRLADTLGVPVTRLR